jgi:hypothetical protein
MFRINRSQDWLKMGGTMTDAKQTNPSPQKCSQCSGSFFCFVKLQEHVHPLCLSCWSLFSDKQADKVELEMRVSNHWQ